MRTPRHSVSVLVLLAILALTGCDSCQPTPKVAAPAAPDDGPAIVTFKGGKDAVWLEDIKHTIRKYDAQYRSRLTEDTQQDALVQRLAASRLLVMEGRASGLDQTPEFRSQSLAYKEGQLASMVLLQIEKDWKAQYKEPDEKDLYEYYLSHSENYKKGEKVRLSLILVRDNDDMPAEERQKAKKKLEEIQARLRLGEDFAKVAEKHSEDSSSINGGDIGFVTRTFDYKIAQVAFNELKYIGDVSGVIEDARFKRIIMLTDRKEDEAVPFEDVVDEIRTLRAKEMAGQDREARISQIIESRKIAEYPDRLRFDVDSCNGDQAVLAEVRGAPPLTVDEYCGTLLDRASFNPGLLENGSHRLALLRDLIQRRALAAEGADGAAGRSQELKFEMRRMEERILYQIFNRHYVDHIYRFESNRDSLEAYYKANLPKFLDPATGQPEPFDKIMDKVRDDFISFDKQDQYGKYIESLWEKHGAVFNRPLLDRHRSEIAEVAQPSGVEAAPVESPPSP